MKPTLRRSLFQLIVGDDETAARAASSVSERGWGEELTRLAWAWRVVHARSVSACPRV